MKFFLSSKPSGFFEVRDAKNRTICFWAAPIGYNREARILENQRLAVTVCAALNACAALVAGDQAHAFSNAQAIRVLLAPEPEGPALWVWNWVGGGYNNTTACSEAEARQHAEKIWPGHKIQDLRRLNEQQAEEYWKNQPYWD